MYRASQHVHSQHGRGAVILVVSRKSGKRKRGSRSAAAIAARGYLKRTRTAGSTTCVQNNHADSRGTGTDGSGHPAVERTCTAAGGGGDDTHSRKRKPCTASAELDRHDRTARACRSGRHTANWQARPVRRRSDEVRGLVVQSEIVPLSRGSAVPARVDDDRSIVDTETQRNPRQRGKRSQHTDVLHARDDNCRSRVGQVSQRDVNERFEAWRQFVMEWEPKLRREIHVNVHHGHALCGQRNIMRVFH